jgi:predicted RNase H-like HicB family nuclease
MKTLRYLVRIDRDRKSDWGASVPDLPGCVATGKTLDSTLRRIRSAIEMHIAGLREDGGAPPRPRSRVVLPGASPNSGVLYACVDVAA